jgi:hypothetical protein
MLTELPLPAGWGLRVLHATLECVWNVRFGSKADICTAPTHVRFTPNSDRESEYPHKVMFALPPKADMCSAPAHVCFGPKADIAASLDYLVRTREEC